MRALLAILATLTLIFTGALPAQAGSSLQAEIDAILNEFPGGVQISANAIEWDDGEVTLTLATEGIQPFAVGLCATGKYCVFNQTILAGSQLSFTTCDKTYSTAALPGGVRSAANARSSGTVKGLNSSGTALTTISAGGRVNVAPSGITQVKCTS